MKKALTKIEVLDKIEFTLRMVKDETPYLSKEDNQEAYRIIGKLYDNVLMEYPI